MLNTTLKKILKRNAPRWLILFIDTYVVVNTFILAYLIRFNFEWGFDTSNLIVQLVLVLVCALLSFLITGSYKGTIRYTSLRDAANVTIANSILFLFLLTARLLIIKGGILQELRIPLSILVIHFLLNVIILIISRYLFKEFYNILFSSSGKNKRILIYGAGEAGLLTASVLKEDKGSKVFIVGFIDDNKRKSTKKLYGIPVFYSEDICDKFVEKKKIDEVIISIQKIEPARLLEIVDNLTKYKVDVKIVPPVKKWINGDLNARQIRSLNIEDLLGRAPIEVNNPILKEEFNNKVVLITGAAGSIGSEISKQIANYKFKQLILIDQAESDLYDLQQYFVNQTIENIEVKVADVRNLERMETIFEAYNPQLIFHAAAYKHVPLMENNPFEAVCVNVKGTKNMADLALKYQVEKFVMVSTDKAVNPTNVMGATKRIAEMYINAQNKQQVTKFITTRFGNVLGSNGSVIPLFKKQIEQGGPLTVTHKDITRFFMTIPEACQLVLEAGTMGKGGEIFVFDMGLSIKIFKLAKDMIHLSGYKYPEDIDIKITGLRPGEKIYEELLANGETTTNTYHEKIMVAKVKPINFEVVKKNIEALCTLNNELNFEKTVRKMKEIVPEFVSNNSMYEKFDVVKNLN
ncbi:NDP-sugar epimerase, includes UDP-GlcNAc-inverting 4,6-dehydratase FlaA1 and capsular polysaccharide biosynthesis protein EpsC [Lutibacter agarilyticus]|uniref:NDP-sugar epimerase, includes UDP-GlcNAc-inverting 4,6-dehydratase FlaA1 and capsular polysaccharide biosynthesis protein EpsC n=1 Tax=Lutibacter agarilyticus TaxID=1109740 RepID=A0A238V6B3_9FLAO|nr:nucleoside-diphosphate sugar epimerase/dehydratase [Lutibacter agarilyticus]SNR29975.1 NDP-sugar epimerase, includes UDP-GlcNAc-inverting 4,6-dehydratase FlaA1 and capsular polysaccharide biosynthesis protein EpsC [Lutibacter agarilyticus]